MIAGLIAVLSIFFIVDWMLPQEEKRSRASAKKENLSVLIYKKIKFKDTILCEIFSKEERYFAQLVSLSKNKIAS